MFFINESIQYAIIDYEYLKNPESVISCLHQNSINVHILCREEHIEQVDTLANFFSDKIHTFSLDAGQNLESFFKERPGTIDDVFISSSNARIHTANKFLIGTILIKESFSSEDVASGADLLLSQGNLSVVAKNNFFAGNAGEVDSYPARELLPGFTEEKKEKWNRKYIRFSTDQASIERVYTLGRYFNRNDSFRNVHHYTKFIQSLKEDPKKFSPILRKSLSLAIDYICKTEKFESYYFTYVPCQPSDQIDRNQLILSDLQRNKGISFQHLLKCPRSFKKQKDLNFELREENVKGKFTATANLEPFPVILFDDVYTSGSTANACADQLLKAGATKVVVLTLASVCKFQTDPITHVKCSHCDGDLLIRHRKSDGNVFWGCEKYRPGELHDTRQFVAGLKQLRKIWE